MASKRRKGDAVRCQAERAAPVAVVAPKPQEIPMLRIVGFVVLAIIIIVLLMVFGLLKAIF
jgi:hypothetical protein